MMIQGRRASTRVASGSRGMDDSRTTWMRMAACSGSDPDALFVSGAAQREAARTCRTCPVWAACLAYALDHRIEYSVWRAG